MDVVQDWAAHFLGSHQQYTPYASQAFTILNTAKSYLSTAKSYLTPLVNQMSSKPDLATLALLLIILFLSLKILNILVQTLLFWLRLAKRIAFWGGLLGLGVWMYTRGPEGVGEDLGYWWSVWNQDYQYWSERERVARMTRQGQRGMGPGMGGYRGQGLWF